MTPSTAGWKANETRRLGRTSVDVTVLGLGTAPLGGLYEEVADDDAVATVHAALDLGVRYFDTAPLYGHGLSERRLGAALADRASTPLGAVVSTKVGRLLRSEAPPEPGQVFRGVPPVNPVFDFSADGVAASLEESLERLDRDRVDIVLVHDPDDFGDQVVRETLPALARWRDEGVVRAIGAGMNQSAMLTRFVDECDIDCVLLAGRYTLLDQSALDDLLPRCLDRGVAVIAGGVFNSGLLAAPHAGARYDYAPAPDDLVARAQEVEGVCDEHGVPLKAAALQFALLHPAVACVLTGARSHDELAENVDLLARPIPAELWEALVDRGLLRADALVDR